MDALDRSLLLLGSAYLTAVATLALTGDRRPDIYVSVSALTYFIYVSLDETLRRSSKLAPINLLVLTIFISAVVYRALTLFGWYG